jgi:putative FmdB family regulatory protein
MPAYDFKCDPCDLTTEVVRPMSDDAKVFCEKCKAEMRMNFSSPKIVYKGSGWAWQEKIPQNTDVVIG